MIIVPYYCNNMCDYYKNPVTGGIIGKNTFPLVFTIDNAGIKKKIKSNVVHD